MNYQIPSKNELFVTPLHESHPVEIHAKNGTIYRFCSQEHADVLIERWNIDVIKVTQTQPRKVKV